MMKIRLLVTKLGSSSILPRSSLPFSLVVTEHIAPFQIRNSDPPVDTIAIRYQSSPIYSQQDNKGMGDSLTKDAVDRRQPGEDTQSMVLLLTQVSDVGGFIIRLRCDGRNKDMSRRGLRKEMHTPMELWERAFRTRPGRFLMNMAEFSRLDWKCAAATYSAVLTQLFAKDTSVEE